MTDALLINLRTHATSPLSSASDADAIVNHQKEPTTLPSGMTLTDINVLTRNAINASEGLPGSSIIEGHTRFWCGTSTAACTSLKVVYGPTDPLALLDSRIGESARTQGAISALKTADADVAIVELPTFATGISATSGLPHAHALLVCAGCTVYPGKLSTVYIRCPTQAAAAHAEVTTDNAWHITILQNKFSKSSVK